MQLLELNPFHPSLWFHKLEGVLSGMSSVSINMSYRIMLEFIVQDRDIILIDIGSHNQVY